MRRGDAIVPERDESKAAEREQPVHKLLDLGGNPSGGSMLSSGAVQFTRMKVGSSSHWRRYMSRTGTLHEPRC